MQSSTLAERKTTHKIYVMEVSKRPGNIKPVEDGNFSRRSQGIESPAAARPTFRPYTVDKDDTLQKIAKKFYDSYGKWTRIHEANKSVIPNPDRIKPGTVLQIPMD